MSRLVIPGLPHHVTQRGVRSIPIFDRDGDRELYLSLLRDQAKECGLKFEGWCLMTNHVHLIVIPKHEDSLARGIGEAHRLYTRARNFREGWAARQGGAPGRAHSPRKVQVARRHHFQGRFGSCVLDEAHLVRALRYVEMNPVRARLAARPEAYRWSSARFHLGKAKSDPLGSGDVAVKMMGDWRSFLVGDAGDDEQELLRRVSTGRPWAAESFIRRLERRTGRRLIPGTGGWPKGVSRKHN